MSIFRDFDTIINRILFGDRHLNYKHTGALSLLGDEQFDLSASAVLVGSLYGSMKAKWKDSQSRSPRKASPENWRFTLNQEIGKSNSKPETQVEKSISRLAGQEKLGPFGWANQVPVASGLIGPYADKRACVDLLSQKNESQFDLIELKMSADSGHALSAAMEVLRYGVAYLFARSLAAELGYAEASNPVLKAKIVRLVVLAPKDYYFDVSVKLLQSLRSAVNQSLEEHLTTIGVRDLHMEIDFEQFGDSFEWPASDEVLIESLSRRRSIFLSCDIQAGQI